MTQPNILYIHSHDTGRYIQPYGFGVDTPHLQHLAEDGVLFRKAFCENPTCSASRAALLTGQCAHNNGMTGLAHRGFSLVDYKRHVLHTLRTVGYRSTLVGMQHIARMKEVDIIGYDEVLDTNPSADVVTPKAVEFIKSKPQEPFFLDVGYLETHRAFLEPNSRDLKYCQPPEPIPDTPETRKDMAAFIASARLFDLSVGRIVNALEATGLKENTLIYCTTDHGLPFPMMKCNLTDHGIGIMLIVTGPGGFTGGKVCDAMVTHMDFFPTACELAGAEKPDWLEGKSMLPLVTGEVEHLHEETYSEVNYHAAYEPMRAVRTDRYKYIKRFYERKEPVLPNCDGGLSKSVLLKRQWAEHHNAREHLYDLTFDPIEVNNLAGHPDYQDALKDMRQRLENWMKNSDDPLLKGDVPAPEGAKITPQENLHPS